MSRTTKYFIKIIITTSQEFTLLLFCLYFFQRYKIAFMIINAAKQNIGIFQIN